VEYGPTLGNGDAPPFAGGGKVDRSVPCGLLPKGVVFAELGVRRLPDNEPPFVGGPGTAGFAGPVIKDGLEGGYCELVDG